MATATNSKRGIVMAASTSAAPRSDRHLRISLSSVPERCEHGPGRECRTVSESRVRRGRVDGALGGARRRDELRGARYRDCDAPAVPGVDECEHATHDCAAQERDDDLARAEQRAECGHQLDVATTSRAEHATG